MNKAIKVRQASSASSKNYPPQKVQSTLLHPQFSETTSTGSADMEVPLFGGQGTSLVSMALVSAGFLKFLQIQMHACN